MYAKVRIGVYKLLLNKMLSKKRYNHSVNVANQASSLAQKYGEDANKAYFAGLLHDICKEMPFAEQEKLILESNLNVSSVELKSQPLWHAVAGAEYIKSHFRINDDDIINSIRYHTVARPDMTLLEKIIYLADAVSADRDYKGVKKLRKLCYEDIDEALLEALSFCINESASKCNTIPVSTIEAYNQLAEKTK